MLISNLATLEINLKELKNLNWLSSRMLITINLSFSTGRSTNFKISFKIETMSLKLWLRKKLKSDKLLKLKSSELRLNSKPKSMKIESKLSSSKRIFIFVILT